MVCRIILLLKLDRLSNRDEAADAAYACDTDCCLTLWRSLDGLHELNEIFRLDVHLRTDVYSVK
jgi:hypothetical protein